METARRYDLDWLRVIVFGLLIFYHVGMFFVPWGWHIKNDEIYDWLMWPMRFLNQWRLPILFVISGMGVYFALGKRSPWKFVSERMRRLLLPLVFGMLFIVPPQIYFERLDQGQFDGGYFEYWPSIAFDGVYPEGNLSWHHLWFLPYLFSFCVLLLPVFLYLRKNPLNPFSSWLDLRVSSISGIYLFIVPLYFIESLVEPFFPETHALIDDWFTFINFLTLFLFGFLLMHCRTNFWQNVQQNRRRYLYHGIIGFIVLMGFRLMFEDSVIVHFIEALFKVFNFWSWILALFGYAAQYLNGDSKLLNYCNTAVYPFYILHQTVTLAIAYYLMHLPWGFWLKASILILGTFAIILVIYETLIRRIPFIRIFFGMKYKS